MKTIMQNQAYTTVPGIFKDGVAIPSTYVPFKKPAKVMIVFLQPGKFIESPEVEYKQSMPYKKKKKELTEQDVLKIVAEGEQAYKEGRTENYDTWMLREYPHIYKTNRSHGNKK